MDHEGTVTDVDRNLLYFLIDDHTKVHMSIALSQNDSQKLPLTGTKVVIKNAHLSNSIYFVCKSSILEGDFSLNYEKDNFLLNFVTKYRFGTADLSYVDSIFNTLKSSFPDLQDTLRINLLKFILKNIVSTSKPTVSNNACFNKSMCQYKVITPNHCRYVEIKSNKFTKFPHWSFGVHSHPKESTILFGYCTASHIYGFLMLKDSEYQMPLIICKATTEKMIQLKHCYILIKKFKVFTEIYQENVPNIEYLLVDFDDITVICKMENDDVNMFGSIMPKSRTFAENIEFLLIRKSMVCIGHDKKCECLFQVRSRKQNEKKELEEFFLIIPAAYIEIIVNFEEFRCYKLFYNTPLKESVNEELKRIQKLRVFQLMDNNAFFLKCDKISEEDKTLNVKDCLSYVKSSIDLVSFHGIIKIKRFATTLSSRTKRKKCVYGFGTPGSKVHQLVFSNKDSGTEIYLDCFLNNWENILMPLGLIPQMEVTIKNVYPQSKKYLKSSIFTTFEIMSYQPSVQFQTVNLYEHDNLNWGNNYFLGLGNEIPYGVLIWGRVYGVRILSVKFTTKESEEADQKEQTQDFLVKMEISDEFGKGRVLMKDVNLMKIILDLQESQFKIWLTAFKAVNEFNYYCYEEETEEVRETSEKFEIDLFKNELTNYLNVVNDLAILSLELKCRKLDSNPNKNRGLPLWFCVDARKC